MHIFLVIVLSVATGLTLYLGRRLINPMPIRRRYKLALWTGLALLLFGQRFSWLMRRNGYEGTLYNTVDWIAFTFLGFISFVALFMLVRDLPILASRTASGLRSLFVKRSKRPYFTGPDLQRRKFFLNATNAAICITALPLTGFAMREARGKLAVVRNDLPILDLPPGLDGFTIAQFSDTHIGPTLRQEWMQRVVDEVNALNPDLIVHTGDMVDGSVANLNGAVSPIGGLKAPHGSFFCTGNHEYYSGVEDWLTRIRQLGMRPLINENTLIDTGRGKILLAGVTDFRAGRIYPPHESSPTKAMLNAPEHDVSILLAHQPQSIYQASQAGFDVQLSGHTHGGQYFPWTMVIHLFQPFVRGLHLFEKTLVYVNVGTGYWGPPLRLDAPPEITLHTLRRA